MTTAGGNGWRPDGGHLGLPVPGRERWQPLRVGLVDLFHYDVEEFRFRDGRLLLRGNNGTGKSKVLALTLPFLLDGDLVPAPGRARRRPGQADGVEPAARRRAPPRRAARLHLAGVRPPRRRRAPALLHARLRAQGGDRAAGIAGHWFFVTDQRVGADLDLVSSRGHRARSSDRLVEALGARGRVYDRAETTGGPSTRRCSGSATTATRRWSTCSSSSASRSCPSARMSQALPRADRGAAAAGPGGDRRRGRGVPRPRRAARRAARPPGDPPPRGALPRALPPLRPDRRAPPGRRAPLGPGRLRGANRQLVAVRRGAGRCPRSRRDRRRAAEGDDRGLAAARAAAQELAGNPEIQRLDRAEELARVAREGAERAGTTPTPGRAAAGAARRRPQRLVAAASSTRTAVLAAVEAAASAAATAGTARDHETLIAPLGLPDGGGDPMAGVDEGALGRARTAADTRPAGASRPSRTSGTSPSGRQRHRPPRHRAAAAGRAGRGTRPGRRAAAGCRGGGGSGRPGAGGRLAPPRGRTHRAAPARPGRDA